MAIFETGFDVKNRLRTVVAQLESEIWYKISNFSCQKRVEENKVKESLIQSRRKNDKKYVE